MNEVAKTQTKAPVKKTTIESYLTSDVSKAAIKKVVGQNTDRFVSSLISAVQTNPALSECTNSSLLNAALIGHSLDLPQSPQLSYYYIVPFNNTKKGCKEATFQLGYRGYMNLALRSGQYKKIHVTEIRKGELVSYDPIEDEYTFKPETDVDKRLKLPVIGYYGFLILNNGYKKGIYWDRAKMDAHAKKYSASYRKGYDSFWKSDFDEMAKKTILRQLLSKYGIMTVDMEKAYTSDMAVIRDDGTTDYVDNTPDEPKKAVDVYANEIPEVKENANGQN